MSTLHSSDTNLFLFTLSGLPPQVLPHGKPVIMVKLADKLDVDKAKKPTPTIWLYDLCMHFHIVCLHFAHPISRQARLHFKFCPSKAHVSENWQIVVENCKIESKESKNYCFYVCVLLFSYSFISFPQLMLLQPKHGNDNKKRFKISVK